ncbi:hypothetical protein CBR_g38615 [Chara braunii]|uniref:Uncharacterized protein n=1 Tax=Chara braunii TaxID=69332 RepID=A0A388K0I9_CHABU|nr:hypothetical protein CBR_g38615 [Chara braunii]|eukprot:GBG63547.1 hypothetical protein CBR_g38615 [Chara braunii]
MAIVPHNLSYVNNTVPQQQPTYPYYNGGYCGGGGLRQRVSNLEELIAKIKGKHEADEASEKAARDEEERKKKEKEEEERRAKDKREREEMHSLFAKEMNARLDGISNAIGGKKEKEDNEVSKLKEEIERLKKSQRGSEASTSTSDKEAVKALQKEISDMRMASEARFGSLEDEIEKERRLRLEAMADAEAWKSEALRPGNKRGSLAIGASPTTQARVRPRVVPTSTPEGTRKVVDEHYRSVVKRHGMEVDLLKEMRLKQIKARREAQEELAKVREKQLEDERKMNKLHERMRELKFEKRKRRPMTNLKPQLDEAAGVSVRKTDTRANKLVSPTMEGGEREKFLKKARKGLKNLRKEEVRGICEKEGITYDKLDVTKEEIAQLRTAREFKDGEGKGKQVVVHEVSKNGVSEAGADGDSATS